VVSLITEITSFILVRQNCSEGTAKKQFEELSKAFESLVLGEKFLTF